MDNVDRDVNGLSYDLKRKNVLRAVADATVLRKEQTRAVPSGPVSQKLRSLPLALCRPKTVDIDGTDIVTSALLFGSTVDSARYFPDRRHAGAGYAEPDRHAGSDGRNSDFYVSSSHRT